MRRGAGSGTGRAARGLRNAAAFAALAAVAAAGAAGCRRSANGATAADTASPGTAAGPPAAARMTLTSPDFADGAPIPRVHAYTGEGENRPPRLGWSDLPPGTVELALIVDDPDAPRPEPWVHDVLYNIPVDATPEAMVLRDAAVDSVRRFVPGTNSWGEPGWGGPFPPPGAPHRYVFTLYALDTTVELPPGATKEQLLAAIDGHVLGTAVLTGTYQRNEPVRESHGR